MKDYNRAFKILTCNFFKFKNYRRMHLSLAIIVGILMSPFAIMGLMTLGFLYVVYYFFKLLLLPAEFLMNFIRFEGKEVKHATQVVIYLVGFPTIFSYYAIVAIQLVTMHIMYLISFIYLWFASLCGFKFRPILHDVDEDLEIEQGPKYNIAVPVVFIAVILSSSALFITSMVLVNLLLIQFPVVLLILNIVFAVLFALLIPLFYLIYVPLVFGHKFKKSPEVEPEPAESKPVEVHPVDTTEKPQ